ncbi:MAG: hypothetical protein HW391_2139 [Chloroflexi bacterium]|nr:hypothetical protein [Chloroflexota bacterium]
MTAVPGTRAEPAGEGLAIERVFDAPRELVWRAWTEPEHFKRWYGPAGMTTHVCRFDLRVGGERFIGMQSPDGHEYHTTGVYLEVRPMDRLVSTEAPSDANGVAVPPSAYGMPDGSSMETTVSVTLESLDAGRTKLTLSQTGFPSADWAAGAGRGWNQGARRGARPPGGVRATERSGAGKGSRTLDLLLGKQTLCQLSYSRSGGRHSSLGPGATSFPGLRLSGIRVAIPRIRASARPADNPGL